MKREKRPEAMSAVLSIQGCISNENSVLLRSLSPKSMANLNVIKHCHEADTSFLLQNMCVLFDGLEYKTMRSN